MKITDKNIQKIKTVDASLETVWLKWTTHAGLKTFFGLDNKIELTPGGPYEIYFLLDQPVGRKGGEGNRVLSFVPNQMLSFTWNAPPQIPEIRNQKYRTWVVVNYRQISQERTEVTLNHLGWPEGEKWDETFDYFQRAWGIVMDSLAESCSR